MRARRRARHNGAMPSTPDASSPPRAYEGTAVIAEVEHQLDLLVRAGRRAARLRADMVDPSMTPLDFSVLAYLARTSGQTQTQVSDAIGIDKTALSKSVAHLQRLGLVTQRQSVSDRRVRLLDLAAPARERVENALASRAAHLRDRFEGWAEEDVDAFVSLLTRYNDAAPDLP